MRLMRKARHKGRRGRRYKTTVCVCSLVRSIFAGPNRGPHNWNWVQPGPSNEAEKKLTKISYILGIFFGIKFVGTQASQAITNFPRFGLACLLSHKFYPKKYGKNMAHFHQLFFGLPKLPYLLLLPWGIRTVIIGNCDTIAIGPAWDCKVA